MKAKQLAIQFVFLCLGIFLATATNLALAHGLEPLRGNLAAPAAPRSVAAYIPVQGRLTNASGTPLNGDYSITFRLYETATGGSALCSATNTVHVENGLFNSEIGGCTTSDVNGRALYLGVQVAGDSEMNPRQQIFPVPYAWSLRPGAIISDTLGGNAILHIENWGSGGRGLRAYAMATSGTNYGIIGASRSPDGYAGYFYNEGGGVGLYARSLDSGNDVILGGNANTTTGDDGVLSSDPAYAGSDLVFLTNDGVRIELDNDGDGEDADLEIRDKDGNNIFNVDESGDVSYSGALIGAFPRPAYNSGWLRIGLNATNTRTHNLGGNIDDYVVDLTCKNVNDSINNRGVGGDWNWEEHYGVYWYDLTTSTITVRRMEEDHFCPQFRVRIWVYK